MDVERALWLAPSLLKSWPCLSVDERRQVRHKLAAASGSLMAVALYATTGNVVECIIATVVALGAVGELYWLAHKLERRS